MDTPPPTWFFVGDEHGISVEEKEEETQEEHEVTDPPSRQPIPAAPALPPRINARTVSHDDGYQPAPSTLADVTTQSPPPLLPQPPIPIHTTQLYSPTRAEIESHPIVRRISLLRDEVTTGLGSAPIEEDSRQATATAPASPAQAQAVAMADKGIEKGDDVSWQWSGGRPGGKAADVVTEGEAKVTSKKGNEIKKKADPEDPAVVIERSGNNVVKRAHELDVEKEGDDHDGKDEEKEENDEAQTGDKRKADEAADADEEEKKDEEDEDEDEEEEAEKKPAGKKQKTAKEAPQENGEKAAPKKKGRPAKKDANGETAASKKTATTKKREPKKAATESGEPRRSGRNASK